MTALHDTQQPYFIIPAEHFHHLLAKIDALQGSVHEMNTIIQDIGNERGLKKLSLLEVARRLGFVTKKPIEKRIELRIFPKPLICPSTKNPFYTEKDLPLLKDRLQESVRLIGYDSIC